MDQNTVGLIYFKNTKEGVLLDFKLSPCPVCNMFSFG